MDVIVTDDGTIEIVEIEINAPVIVRDNNTATTIEQLAMGPQGEEGPRGQAGYSLLSTLVDFTIATNESFLGVDEFTVNGASTLIIEGTGRMMLIG